jgi:hypothetical protein
MDASNSRGFTADWKRMPVSLALSVGSAHLQKTGRATHELASEYFRASFMQSVSRIAAFAVRRVFFAAARTSASSSAPVAFKAVPRTFSPVAAVPARFFSASHG